MRHPVTGFAPKPTDATVINISETEQYTGTVVWYVPTGNGVLREIDVGDKFAAGIEYTAEIILTHKRGYTFHGVEANFFTIDGIPAANIANSGIVTATFLSMNLFASGDGTSSNPFIINTAEQLSNLRYFSDAHFKLGTSIDLQNIPWTPIPEFTGTLNGNDKIISNLRMTFTNGIHKTINYRDCISYGLIVHNKGTIQNVQVTANIDLTNVPGNYSLPKNREIVVGAVAAINEGKIQNTKVSTSSGSFMINSTIHVRAITGGIAGYNDNNGSITSCTNNGTILSSGTTGGIMGCNIGDTSSCINNGTIRYTYTNHNSGIGGIAGESLMGFMLSGTNNGTIVYANTSSTSQLIQPAMGHIAGSTYSACIPINSFIFSSGTVNIGTLQTVGSHNQALYAGNRALGRGYILTGNVIISIP